MERKLIAPSRPALALVSVWLIKSQLRHSSLGPGLVLQSPWAQEQQKPAGTSLFPGWLEDESGIPFLHLDLTACPWV